MPNPNMIDTYRLACELRAQADRTGDPQTYRLAAEKFIELGFQTAAAKCYERAAYYEKVTAND